MEILKKKPKDNQKVRFIIIPFCPLTAGEKGIAVLGEQSQGITRLNPGEQGGFSASDYCRLVPDEPDMKTREDGAGAVLTFNKFSLESEHAQP